jgi:hypothetical protein
MTSSPEHIDQPEPRWQALFAFLAICAIYLALHAISFSARFGCCRR